MTKPLSAAELTRELVRFKTINPPGDELPCARYIGGLLEAAGFETVYHPMGDNRANLIARLGGRPGKRPICFSGHTDVVPLGQREWSVDPFAAEVKDGRIYGRGTTDMKGGVAAIVAAAVRLAPRLAIGPGVILVITAGEERGCEGANFLAKRGLLPWAGAMVIAEPTSNAVCAGHKGVLWLEGVCEGVTAHGSTPEHGDNAVYKAARAALTLAGLDLSSFAHPILGKPTVNVGWMRGGMNVNSVPDEARFGVDLRVVPGADHMRLLGALKAATGPDVRFDVKGSADAVWTEESDIWVQQVLTVASSVTGQAAQLGGATYFTDAGALKPGMGSPPTVILGPGDAELAHQTDESCSIQRIEQAQAIYENVIANWCEL